MRVVKYLVVGSLAAMGGLVISEAVRRIPQSGVPAGYLFFWGGLLVLLSAYILFLEINND